MKNEFSSEETVGLIMEKLIGDYLKDQRELIKKHPNIKHPILFLID